MTSILVGDIGATGAKFATVRGKNGILRINPDSRITLPTLRLRDEGTESVIKEISCNSDGIAIGAAGDVQNGKCVLTWLDGCEVNEGKIASATTVRTRVWNDLAPVLPGADQLYTQIRESSLDPEEVFVHINSPKDESNVRAALRGGLSYSIAPGSGTGVSVGTFEDEKITVYGTEGGHVTSPLGSTGSKIDDLFNNYLKSKYPYRTVETITRNQALVDIFNFWRAVKAHQIELPNDYAIPEIVSCAMKYDFSRDLDLILFEIIDDGVLAKYITEMAEGRYKRRNNSRIQREPICELAQFNALRLLGLSIGNLSLYKPTGGIFLAGGIVSKLTPFLLDESPELGDFTFAAGLRDRESKAFQDTVLRYPVTGIKTLDVYHYGLAMAFSGQDDDVANEVGLPRGRVKVI